MGGLAFVFAGQGSQHAGMDADVYREHEAAARVMDRCEALRPGTRGLCLEGPEDELRKTSNAQPCLFAVELASAAVLREAGIEPDAVAGFSLGEMAAATFAGVFDLDTGFQLVCRRGELMQEAAEAAETSMVAVLGLPARRVEELCGPHDGIYPVNYNCPGQVSVSGLARQMPAFVADAKAAGGRVVPLKVAGAFHSPFMATASDAFGDCLARARVDEPATRIYSNVTAAPYGDARQLLARQIASPVRWEDTIRNMISDGIDRFVEIGPGKALANMIRKIDPSVEACSAVQALESRADATPSEV